MYLMLTIKQFSLNNNLFKRLMIMRKLFVLMFLMLFAQPFVAQQRTHPGASEKLSSDSTLSLSIQKFDARLQELQGELEKQVKTKDQAQKVLQQTEDNIKTLQSAIQAMMMIKQDTTLHVSTKSKQ